MIWSDWAKERATRRDNDLLIKIGYLLCSAHHAENAHAKCKPPSFECHTIARGLWLELGNEHLEVETGDFLGLTFEADGMLGVHRCSHSWLRLKESGNIIDPYPVGRISMGPMIVIDREGTYRAFAGGMYRKNPEASVGLPQQDLWRRARVLQKLFSVKKTGSAA